MSTFVSDISGKEFSVSDKIAGSAVRKKIAEIIRIDHPTFSDDSFLALQELNSYREKYISNCLFTELDELSELESNVLESLKDQTTITDKVEDEPAKSTLGQRVADRVATFGGSWTFIISFGVFLLCWIGINFFWLSNKGFDPYPFILLNLILSCLAAMQAPVIMMSQNRQEQKDRERAKKDYMINLKSELEIRMLHEKLDHLILHQQQDLIEIQKVQVDMMNDILARINK
jgi:uncharacterized membrane protein